MSERDRSDDSYTGRAGQQAFIAQVLLRFGNAAVPLVDVGTDVLVFSDEVDTSARVQVKTAVAAHFPDESGYEVQFNLPLKQLLTDDPPLFFALVTRDRDSATFLDYLMIPRADVIAFWTGVTPFGYEDKTNRCAKLVVRFHRRVMLGVTSREVELTVYRNNWRVLPPVLASLVQAAESSDGNL